MVVFSSLAVAVVTVVVVIVVVEAAVMEEVQGLLVNYVSSMVMMPFIAGIGLMKLLFNHLSSCLEVKDSHRCKVPPHLRLFQLSNREHLLQLNRHHNLLTFKLGTLTQVPPIM